MSSLLLLIDNLCEFQILTDWQDKKGDRRFLKLGRDHELGAPPKHGKPKKQKLEGKAGHGPGPGPGRPKSKNLQPKIQEYEFTDDPIDVPRIPKNDAPNRFWAIKHRGALGFGQWKLEGLRAEAGGGMGCHLGCASPCRFWASVEPYCADITSEEVRTLEELLKPPEDEAEHYKVETVSLSRYNGEEEGSEVPENQRSQSRVSSSFPYPVRSPVCPINPPR